MGECGLDRLHHRAPIHRDHANPQLPDQFGVALFLARDHLVDDHGTTRRDRFLDDCATGLPYQEMMLPQELGHLVGPAHHPHAVTMLGQPARQFLAQQPIPSDRDREVQIRYGQETVQGLAALLPAGVHQVKHAGRPARSGEGSPRRPLP